MSKCERRSPAPVAAWVRLGLCLAAQSGCGGIEFKASDSTEPLVTWNGPLSEAALGQTPGASVTGKSLYAIVSSQVSGRPDGLLCSNCHFKGSGRPYSPDVAKDGWAPIAPETVVSGKTWAAQNGWADSFVALPAKPGVLKLPFDAWRKEGNL